MIVFNAEHQLKVRLPFLKSSNTVVFIAADKESDERFAEKLTEVRRILSEVGMNLVYLPEVLETVPEDVRTYVFPGMDSVSDICLAVYSSLLSQRVEYDRMTTMAFFRRDGFGDRYFSIDPKDIIGSVWKFVEGIIKVCPKREELPSKKPISKRLRLKKKSILDYFDEECISDIEEFSVPDNEISFEASAVENDDTAKILEELKEIQRKYGVSLEEIEALIQNQVTLSDLYVTRNGRIFLPGYGNRELDLDPLSIALYILYLKHPEGIAYPYLQDYKRELLEIYSPISNKGDLQDIVDTVAHLVDPENSSQVSIHVSRIKRAFIDIMTDRVAKFYYIKGPLGEPKKIELGRKHVIWG